MKGIARRSSNVTPSAWKNVGSYLSAAERKQFATEGAYMGTPWLPLAPSTIISKARRGFGNRKILVETGAMRQGFTGRPMLVETYAGKTAIFGSDSQIARWQHFGTHRDGNRHIPPRTIMKVTPQISSGVCEIIAAYVLGHKARIGDLL
jgi:phage gpG-like protein